MVFAAAAGGGGIYNIPCATNYHQCGRRQKDPILFFLADHSQSQQKQLLSWRCSSAVAGEIFIRRYPSDDDARPLSHSRKRGRRRRRPFSPVMEWQESTVKMDIDVPISVAYDCYLDRESIPRWMPFISTVEVLKDKPELSRWSLKYKAFARDIEFSWLARNMQPIPNQKIHWRSMEGLPNRGAVRFFPKGPSSCTVELTVAYEVPQLLSPVASALQPFLESLLVRGLERFSRFAKSYSTGPAS